MIESSIIVAILAAIASIVSASIALISARNVEKSKSEAAKELSKFNWKIEREKEKYSYVNEIDKYKLGLFAKTISLIQRSGQAYKRSSH